MGTKKRLKRQFTCTAFWWEELWSRLLHSYLLVHVKSVSEFRKDLYWDNVRAVHLACWHFCKLVLLKCSRGIALWYKPCIWGVLGGRGGICLWRFERHELKGSNAALARPNSSLSESVHLFQEQCKEQMKKRSKLKPQIQMLHNCFDSCTEHICVHFHHKERNYTLDVNISQVVVKISSWHIPPRHTL